MRKAPPPSGSGDDADKTPEQIAADGGDLFSDEQLTRIVKDYMPLVRHAVNRIAVGSTNAGILQYEDMVSCGVQGLIEAWHAFDPNKGAKFSTYALPRIRGSILDSIRATHPLPRCTRSSSGRRRATSWRTRWGSLRTISCLRCGRAT